MKKRNLILALASTLLLAACTGEPAEESSSYEVPAGWSQISEEKFGAWASEANEGGYANVTTYQITMRQTTRITKGGTYVDSHDESEIFKIDLNADNAYFASVIPIYDTVSYTEIAKNSSGTYVETNYEDGEAQGVDSSYEALVSKARGEIASFGADITYRYGKNELVSFQKSDDGTKYKAVCADISTEDTFIDANVTVKVSIKYTGRSYIFDDSGLLIGQEATINATCDHDGYSYEATSTTEGQVNGTVSHESVIPA